MTPDRAIAAGAMEASRILDMLETPKIEPEALLQILKALVDDCVFLSEILADEAITPGTFAGLPEAARESYHSNALALASGALLAYALSPGIEQLPGPKVD